LTSSWFFSSPHISTMHRHTHIKDLDPLRLNILRWKCEPRLFRLFQYSPSCIVPRRIHLLNVLVRTATRYGLDVPGIESRWGRDFPHLSKPALGPTQPPIKWILGLSPGVKRPGRGVDHPPPSSAEVHERVQLYLYSPFWVFVACCRVTFTFTFFILLIALAICHKYILPKCIRRCSIYYSLT
jgi:hypothetical protein